MSAGNFLCNNADKAKSELSSAKADSKSVVKIIVQPTNPKPEKMSKRAVSSDLSKSIKKRTFNPLMTPTITKKRFSRYIKDPIVNGPLDLLSLYLREPSKLREQLEKTMTSLSIKVFISAGTNSIYKCEKSGIKFDLHFNTSIDAGIVIQTKRRQGSNNCFRDIVNSIFKRLNEITEG